MPCPWRAPLGALGRRRASTRAFLSRNSICALLLRSSSWAQRVIASWTVGSSLTRTLLRSEADRMVASLVYRSDVDHRLGRLVAAENDEQVGHHGGPGRGATGGEGRRLPANCQSWGDRRRRAPGRYPLPSSSCRVSCKLHPLGHSTSRPTSSATSATPLVVQLCVRLSMIL